jgi:hypothetical protein
MAYPLVIYYNMMIWPILQYNMKNFPPDIWWIIANLLTNFQIIYVQKSEENFLLQTQLDHRYETTTNRKSSKLMLVTIIGYSYLITIQ